MRKINPSLMLYLGFIRSGTAENEIGFRENVFSHKNLPSVR